MLEICTFKNNVQNPGLFFVFQPKASCGVMLIPFPDMSSVLCRSVLLWPLWACSVLSLLVLSSHSVYTSYSHCQDRLLFQILGGALWKFSKMTDISTKENMKGLKETYFSRKIEKGKAIKITDPWHWNHCSMWHKVTKSKEESVKASLYAAQYPWMRYYYLKLHVGNMISSGRVNRRKSPK